MVFVHGSGRFRKETSGIRSLKNHLFMEETESKSVAAWKGGGVGVGTAPLALGGWRWRSTHTAALAWLGCGVPGLLWNCDQGPDTTN